MMFEGKAHLARKGHSGIMERTAFLALLLLFPLQAQAYVDPGSGMLLWQGLVAVFGAALLFFRKPWQTLMKWWRHLRGK